MGPSPFPPWRRSMWVYTGWWPPTVMVAATRKWSWLSFEDQSPLPSWLTTHPYQCLPLRNMSHCITARITRHSAFSSWYETTVINTLQVLTAMHSCMQCLNTYSDMPTSVGSAAENRILNRFKDILPCKCQTKHDAWEYFNMTMTMCRWWEQDNPEANIRFSRLPKWLHQRFLHWCKNNCALIELIKVLLITFQLQGYTPCKFIATQGTSIFRSKKAMVHCICSLSRSPPQHSGGLLATGVAGEHLCHRDAVWHSGGAQGQVPAVLAREWLPHLWAYHCAETPWGESDGLRH